jgi:prepilin signal peptidase PulO-like enzyme (type II secretory pathway)
VTLFPLIVSFVLGAIIASFAGVVAARLHTGQSVVRGRSGCDACGRELASTSLVPLISYLASGGRAHCCGARISWLAPLTELILGALYALAYAELSLSPALPVLWVALAIILVLVLYDLAHMILPYVLLAPLLASALLFAYLRAPDIHAFLIVLGAALILAFLILLMHVLSRGRAMGLADAPLTLALALLAGPAAIAGFVYAFWLGAVVGIVILLRRPAGSRIGVEVPFAPYLALGFLLALFIPWNPFFFLGGLLAGSPL